MTSKRLDKSLSTLMHEADAVFSKYIRTKHSVNGFCWCFICDIRMKISVAHCGHYISRDHMPTRYDEMNCKPVCSDCNCFDAYHEQRFRLRLLEILTPEGLHHLHVKSQGLQKFMRHELLDLIDTYKLKLKELR